MDFWAVILISLGIGLVLVMGGALLAHMSSLVKNAYQLKIEIQGEIADGQRKLEEEADKKLRWMKRELVEEVEKTKAALQADFQRRVVELADGWNQRLDAQDEILRHERPETAKQIEALRQDVMVLDQRLRLLRREQRPAVPPVSPPEPPPTEATPAPAPTDTPFTPEAILS